MTIKIKSQEQLVFETMVAVRNGKHTNGEYNDETCWCHLRQACPHASDDFLALIADRVELRMTK